MSYQKNSWSDGDIITAGKLNNIENGVESVDTNVIQATSDISTLQNRVTALEEASSTPADYQELVDDVSSLKAKIEKRFRASLLVDGKSEGTVYQYIRTIHKLTNVIYKPYPEMGIYDVRFFLASEQERGISNRTRENTRANLSAFFQWMVNDEIIPKNPIAALKTIKYKDEVRKPFSEVEIDALRSSCKQIKERAIIELLLSTGVRVSELVNIQIQDVNFDNLSVHVTHGKGNKERMTYTTPVCIKHLLNYLSTRNDNLTYLLINKNHEPLSDGGIRYILKTIAKRANVNDVHPHRFRRTFATGLAKRGMKVEEIRDLLGHSDLNTTMRYVYMDDSNVKSSYSKYMN